ncbi:phosphotransferase enzyme family protein [Penicillium herquei]|nr:phosphotransferase enzyme family protein [Penicillium herquei]
MLLAVGFGYKGTQTFPFVKLRQHVGEAQWARREQEFKGPAMEAFGAWKESKLRRYCDDFREMRKTMEKIESEEITRQEFLDLAFDMLREKRYAPPS